MSNGWIFVLKRAGKGIVIKILDFFTFDGAEKETNCMTGLLIYCISKID
jgi:hypothetical protein